MVDVDVDVEPALGHPVLAQPAPSTSNSLTDAAATGMGRGRFRV
jgi:hypothetical protein